MSPNLPTSDKLPNPFEPKEHALKSKEIPLASNCEQIADIANRKKIIQEREDVLELIDVACHQGRKMTSVTLSEENAYFYDKLEERGFTVFRKPVKQGAITSVVYWGG